MQAELAIVLEHHTVVEVAEVRLLLVQMEVAQEMVEQEHLIP
jgi:hypothetical protein